ncbi:MAG: hypothetical protein IPP76_08255 [Moraxellaceae bacterium]|nr:hypothetical protein [Moraxellaceae bacterium]
MDDLTKALEGYKSAFKQKLDNYVLDAMPLLDKPATYPQKNPVKSTNKNLETKGAIIEIEQDPIWKTKPEEKETPKKEDEVNPKQKKQNEVNPPISTKEDATIPQKGQKAKAPQTFDKRDTELHGQPPAAPTPITRHIAHRIITSISVRFSLGLILLLFL